MWKQKQWKYKNSTPRVPKKEEWLRGISAVRLMQTCSNYIKAGCSYMAFNVDSSGPGCLGILPSQSTHQQTTTMFTLSAHGEFVSDFDFSPHTDSRLATASFDGTAKLWSIVQDDSSLSCNLLTQLPSSDKRVECVQWHPYVDDVLVLASGKAVSLLSGSRASKFAEFSQCTDVVQSIAWSMDGKLLASSCKDKIIRLFDPRAALSGASILETAGHQNPRDSRVIWTDENYILTTGFNQAQNREISVYDCRSFKSAVSVTHLDSGSGTLMPFFDSDTSMLFLAGKGDTSVRFYEFSKATPFVVEGGCDTVVQVKGAALVPKLAVNTSAAEVNRLLLLTQTNIVPLPYIVPRKVTSEFYEDLYPDTYSGQPVWTLEEWLRNEIREIPKVTMRPSYKKTEAAEQKAETVGPSAKDECPAAGTVVTPSHRRQNEAPRQPIPENVTAPAAVTTHSNVPAAAAPTSTTRLNVVAPTTRYCRLRNFIGTVAHKSTHIENLQGLNHSVPLESDGFAANWTRCAVLLSGAGGQVLVVELNQPGRVSSAKHHILHNREGVTDFTWDPFDDSRLACGCSDGSIKLWLIRAESASAIDTPEFVINAIGDRIHTIRFNPLAQDIIAASSFDSTVRVWDLASKTLVFVLEGHHDIIFALAWSQDGSQLATYCKDNIVRIYRPRKSTSPLQEFSGPSGFRGGRIHWVRDDKSLLVAAFDRHGRRLLALYDANLTTSLCTVDVDTATSVLIPYYDADNSVVFLSGRGDTTLYAYELCDDEPNILPLPSYAAGKAPHQAMGFLSKRNLNVSTVEFAKACRLTSTSIEPVSFTVPRVKMEYFQDDIFPETLVTWQPLFTAEEWISGVERNLKTVSLCPPGMKKASELAAQSSAAAAAKTISVPAPRRQQPLQLQSDASAQQESLVTSLNEYVAISDKEPLPQDLMEGVDPSEWDD